MQAPIPFPPPPPLVIRLYCVTVQFTEQLKRRFEMTQYTKEYPLYSPRWGDYARTTREFDDIYDWNRRQLEIIIYEAEERRKWERFANVIDSLLQALFRA